MVQCSDILDMFEKLAPSELAEDWDNTGLLVGRNDKNIKKIMLCLDITKASADEAVRSNVDLIISHHPVIFRSLSKIIESEPKGNILYTLIRNDICAYAAHTNLDFAESGVNTLLAEILNLKNVALYGEGPGKTGMLPNIVSLHEFIMYVKSVLNADSVRAVGEPDAKISKAAVFSGSFDNNLNALLQSGADVLVTGDLKHHTVLDLREAGLSAIDAGHFNTEVIILPVLADIIKNRFPDIEVFCFKKEEEPFKVY